jgi:hypothetical protein
MNAENTNFVTDMFRHSTDMVNHAMTAGIKFQEESTRFWNDNIGRNVDRFLDQADRIGREFAPTVKKNLQRFRQDIDRQTDKGADFVRRSFESAETAIDDGVFDRTMQLWRSSFDTMRSGFDTMTKANAQIVENWASMTEKCFETTTGTRNSSESDD